MGAEFDGEAAPDLEGMAKHQALGLRVDGAALGRGGEPGRADFDPRGGVVDVHVGGHADGRAAGVEDGEGDHLAPVAERQAAVDLGRHPLGRGDKGVPQFMQAALGHLVG